jgi:hypothetical protein
MSDSKTPPVSSTVPVGPTLNLDREVAVGLLEELKLALGEADTASPKQLRFDADGNAIEYVCLQVSEATINKLQVSFDTTPSCCIIRTCRDRCPG